MFVYINRRRFYLRQIFARSCFVNLLGFHQNICVVVISNEDQRDRSTLSMYVQGKCYTLIYVVFIGNMRGQRKYSAVTSNIYVEIHTDFCISSE